ncbi:MAG: hypothetical protein QGG40_14425 [Myxococcota bacterium]|nr:hypothetical protein [Myxococcota bacterium]
MGVAGAMLARRVGGFPWLGALAAMSCSTVLAGAADGMTEGFSVGWVGIQLALLLDFLRDGRPRQGLAAAVALAVTWYSGPYNGVWASLLNLGLVCGWAVRRARSSSPVSSGFSGHPPGPEPRVLIGRSLAVAVGAAVCTVPYAWSVLQGRSSELPGSASRSGLPQVVENPTIYRGGVQTGADLLDLWLPGFVTGAEAPVSHTAYLGVVTLAAALWAVRQNRKLWPWLLGALSFAALSLGPHLYLEGSVLRWQQRPLLGVPGLLILALPVLGRLTRWYRAGAVATLLLAPLVSTIGHKDGSASGSLRAMIVGFLLVTDILLLAPLAWPLHATQAPDESPFLALDGEGALLEIPPTTNAEPPPGQWRDWTGLVQTLHGRPVGGTLMNLPASRVARAGQGMVANLLRDGTHRIEDWEQLRDHGFRWLAVYPRYRPLPGRSRERLERCMGPPVAETDDVWLFALSGAWESDCSD